MSAATAGTATAQTSDLKAGTLNPFPEGDVYRLHLIGDRMATGLKPELDASLRTMARVRLHGEVIEVRSLRRSNWDRHVEAIRSRRSGTPIDMAVVMFGAREIGSVFTPGQSKDRFASETWQRKYAVRVDSVMKALKANKGAVYWVGLPVVRRRDHSEGFRMINALVRERAYVNGVNFIDVYSRFLDEKGGYDRYGPDLDGTIKLLRSKDGVYFTQRGYAKIAQLVVRMIRRDLNSVKADRVVSLAGSETEQSSIRRAREAARTKRRRPGIQGVFDERRARRKAGAGGRAAADRTFGARRADNGRATITAMVENKATSIKLDLPRPALSAAVMALVTRNRSPQKPAQLGDNAVQVIGGGVPLLSTVSPADQTALALRQRRLSPTQSVFFKVWGKGERLDPKPGRADDFQWPRPVPKPVVHAKTDPAAQRARLRARLRRNRDPNLPPLPGQNPLR